MFPLMKIGACLVLLGLSTVSHAGMKLPKGIYEADRLEEAAAEAKKENKALAFVLSDLTTTCPLCINATSMAFKKLKAHSTIVFLNSKGDARWSAVNPMVVTGLCEPKMGKIIPKAAITSPDMSELWGQMTYEDLKNDNKYREMKKQIAGILEGSTQPDNPPDRFLYWPLKGKDNFYIGSFQGLDDSGTLTLKMKESGKPAKIPLSRLTGSCAVFAKKLAGGENIDQAANSKTPPPVEAWIGNNGKTLQARFVSLEDAKVTLEMEGGKTYTIPLERLAEESQEKAKALQTLHQP